jgi:outer membrane protein assembly factor BamD
MSRICILFPVTMLLLSGCFSSQPEPEIKEIKPKDAPEITGTEDSLFQRAKRSYANDTLAIAKDNFQAVLSGFPQGPYAEFSEIKLADCDFELGNFDAAANKYQAFLDTHPSSDAIPYVLFRLGRSYQNSTRGPGRDSAPLKKAVAIYSRLSNEYPETIYARSAAPLKHTVLSHLAENDQMVIDYYRRRESSKAFEARKEEFDRSWATLGSSTPQPVALLGQAPQSSTPRKPSVLAVRLGELDSPLMLSARRSTANSEPQMMAAFTNTKRPQIQRVECNAEKKLVMIFLSRLPESTALASDQEIVPTEGQVNLRLPGFAIEPENINCFAENDLRLTPQEGVQLASSQPVQAFVVDTPPRILLSVR